MTDEKWPDGLLPLASLVDALRDELRDARGRADPTLTFLVGPVTVELNVVARREASAKFGAKFFAFLDTGVEAKAGRDTTHKLTFTLTPGDPTSADGQLRVGDKTGRPPLPSPDR